MQMPSDTNSQKETQGLPTEGSQSEVSETDNNPTSASHISVVSSKSGEAPDSEMNIEPAAKMIRSPGSQQQQAAKSMDSQNMFVKLKPVPGRVGSLAASFSAKMNEQTEAKHQFLSPKKIGSVSPISASSPPWKKLSTTHTTEPTETKPTIPKLRNVNISSLDTKPTDRTPGRKEADSGVVVDTDESKNRFARLRKVQSSSLAVRDDENELSRIQLRRSLGPRATPSVSC